MERTVIGGNRGYGDGVNNMTIRPAYSMWPQYNRRLREVVAAMTDEQLAIRPSADLLPMWATVGHTAGVRVFWLCEVMDEPGADSTPFTDVVDTGWEDDLNRPRGADELVEAIDSTWRLVDSCLDRWTADMLADEFHRDYNGTDQAHTRGSILQRLFSHDAYHCGELSQTLGINGLPQIDLWRRD
jgi:uncharacterized damage-inducible protein DinB